MQKNHHNRLHGAPPHIVKYTVFLGACLFLVILGMRTARMKSRTKVIDGSKDVFPVQELPFWGSVDGMNPEGSTTPKYRQNLTPKWKFTAYVKDKKKLRQATNLI